MATFDFRPIDKVVFVELPDSTVSVQEVYDSCVEWLAAPENLDTSNFVSAEGKADLGGGEQTGVTLIFFDDWRLQFADRGGPSWENCYVTGGNFVATNIYGNDPIKPGAYVNTQIRQSQSPTIVEVAGGSSDWTSGEQEEIRQALGVTGTKAATSGGNVDTLLVRLDAQRAANLDELTLERMEQLDSGVSGSLPLEMGELLDVRLTAGRAVSLDNLDATVSSRAQPGDAMTLTVGERQAIAGAVLTYDMGNGRTVVEALASARNRWRITGTSNPYTYEVYDTDDGTILWSAVCTIAAGGEVTEINPT
jgi:hypothetical protein